jgi:hypothetical protein
VEIADVVKAESVQIAWIAHPENELREQPKGQDRDDYRRRKREV